MKDRVSLHPGRVKLIPVAGQENVYDTVRADEPTQEGDPLSKATFLKDATAALFGLGSDAVPNDVFMKLAVPAGYYGFDITVMFLDGSPIPGVLLNGLQNVNLGDAITDANGRCVAVASTKTATVTISDYIGVPDTEISLSAEDGVTLTPVNITLERDTSVHLIQTSKTLKVLTGVPVDMCIVGGGASGIFTKYESVTGGYGGGGGFAKNILGVVLANPNVELVVGAGGEKSTTTQNVSNAGGDSSVTYDGTTVTAQGSPGVNGNGSYGGDGTTHVFNDDSLPLPGGSGGTGKVGAPANEGGKDFGGRGVYWSGGVPIYATNGQGPGGGGGGGASDGRQHGHPGSGASGGLYIRVNNPGVSA